MTHPFLQGLRAPLHISHRGGAKLAPENTMAAFEQAVKTWRTDMLELDIHATKDGEVVVAHDPTLERCTDGAGELASLTFAELSRLDAGFHFELDGAFPFRGRGVRIPRLTEVLRAFPGLRVNVELKTARVLDAFVALVREEKCIDRLCIGAELDPLARALSERLPDACLFYPRDALAAFVLPVKGGDEPEDDARYTVLDMPYEYETVTMFDAALARVAAARGKWINVWTVDEPEQMRTAIREGVGGVMTDRPDLLRAVIDAR